MILVSLHKLFMTSEVECDTHCTIENLTLKISRGQLPPCPPLCTALSWLSKWHIFSTAGYSFSNTCFDFYRFLICPNWFTFLMDFAAITPIRNSSGTGYSLHRYPLGQGIVFRRKFWSRLKAFFCGRHNPV